MKLIVDKKISEKVVTYCRQYIKTHDQAYLDAKSNALDELNTKFIAREAITDIAWLIARNNKTNEDFWKMLAILDIYPNEV